MNTCPCARLTRSALLLLAMGLAIPDPKVRASSPQLVWNDEFNQALGSGPDPTRWTYDLGVGDPPGWGNNELEIYTNSRSNSVIVADPDATDGRALAIVAQSSNGSYTSARLNTEDSFSFKYGRLEARARVPTGVGLWPAFWALGADIATVTWPACGEIDVMEWIGSNPTQIAGSMHATGYSGGNALTADYALPGALSFSSAYHVFAVDWYPNELVFSVDGVVYEDRKESAIPAGSEWPFNQNFFILLNLAVGGDYPGPPNSSTQFPQSYLVDYVRVYSLPTSPPPGLVWAPSPPLGIEAAIASPTKVIVSWQPPFSTFGAAVSGYVLQRAGDAAFTQGMASWNLPASPASFQDTSVVAGGSYYYRVSAVSANGTSDPSAPVALVTGSPAPIFQPQSQTVSVGSTVVFNFSATGSPAYQWYLNGSPIPSATNATLVISPSAAANEGTYSCTATNAVGSVNSGAATLSVVGTANPGRLINLSCRAAVGTGAEILIVGFAVGGAGASGPESLLLRASGPALASFNVGGTLPDPRLQLFSGSALLATNSGWGGDPSIASAAAEVGAFAWSSPTSNDAALLTSQTAGPYTAEVSGVSGDTGVALTEVYDATPEGAYTPSTPRLVNVSARVQVGTGSNILIAGFVVGGTTSKAVLVRASGPALAPLGVAGTLPDPNLELMSQTGGLIASNSGWGGDPQITSAAAAVGAFSWNDATSNDSAILASLPPGAYTAQVSGSSGDTGVALVEVYEVP